VGLIITQACFLARRLTWRTRTQTLSLFLPILISESASRRSPPGSRQCLWSLLSTPQTEVRIRYSVQKWDYMFSYWINLLVWCVSQFLQASRFLFRYPQPIYWVGGEAQTKSTGFVKMLQALLFKPCHDSPHDCEASWVNPSLKTLELPSCHMRDKRQHSFHSPLSLLMTSKIARLMRKTVTVRWVRQRPSISLFGQRYAISGLVHVVFETRGTWSSYLMDP